MQRSDETTSDAGDNVAHVNGVPLQRAHERLDMATLRQRACGELLRQAAQRAGLLVQGDSPAVDGVMSEAASAAIETLIEQELALPEPSDEACLRHYSSHLARYRIAERVRARHILFAVMPGVDMAALRRQAEHVLLELRCHDGDAAAADEAFAAAARQWSNCPSAETGGDLGWLSTSDCAREFARELFGHTDIGVLPRLVRSRFGLHVVEVLARDPGIVPPFDAVREAVALTLRQQNYVVALRQYLSLLAGQARVHGVALSASSTPLVR